MRRVPFPDPFVLIDTCDGCGASVDRPLDRGPDLAPGWLRVSIEPRPATRDHNGRWQPLYWCGVCADAVREALRARKPKPVVDGGDTQ